MSTHALNWSLTIKYHSVQIKFIKLITFSTKDYFTKSFE